MAFDFTDRKVTLVTCPVDLRKGFLGLASISSFGLGIDIAKGEDYVVFVSKNRNLLKIIYSDASGGYVVAHRLHQGVFQKVLNRLEEDKDNVRITAFELSQYLDGKPIYLKKEKLP